MPSDPHTQLLVDAHGIGIVSFPTKRFDGLAIRELFETAMTLIDSPNPRLLVDCTDITLITSGGIGMLITLHKRFVAHGGHVVTAIPDESVMQSLKLTHMHLVLNLAVDVESAQQSLLEI